MHDMVTAKPHFLSEISMKFCFLDILIKPKSCITQSSAILTLTDTFQSFITLSDKQNVKNGVGPWLHSDIDDLRLQRQGLFMRLVLISFPRKLCYNIDR